MAYITFQPNDHFNTKLYTGNGSTQNITGVGHQVDWTWIKYRTDTEGHGLFDVLRGALYRLQSNSDSVSSSQAGTVTAFGSDGFSLGSNAEVNANNGSYVSWNWKANGAGSANTDGSINTTATSANTTSGFSIVKYTGTGSNATVGHGLGAVPKMIIIKSMTGTQWWFTYHVSMGNDRHVTLNTTNDQSGTSAAYWNNTTPTSSVFSIGTDTGVNQSGVDYIAYCFAEKKGFSKIGFYRGNGNADGAFAYTGFKPAFVLFKEYTGNGSANWTIQDSKRVGFNPNNNRIYPNDSAVENTSSFRIDMLSNGFKLRSSDGDSNEDGNNFLYLAFAEEPFVASNGTPATAR